MITLLLACRPDLAPPVAPAPSSPSSSETVPTPSDTASETLPDDSGTTGGWRSVLYPADWTPAFTAPDGHFLHDFSYAGYRRGEVPLPTDPPGPHEDVVVWGADPTGTADSTAAIQAAIDAASAEAPAVVDVPAGAYRVDGLLRIGTSGVVLKGAGSAVTFLTFTLGTGIEYGAHLTVAGALVQGPDLPLVADGVSRETSVVVADPADLAVGDTIDIGWVITDGYVAEHGMTGTWTEFVGQWKAIFRRTVTAVDLATGVVTFDVPLRSEVPVRHGASVRETTGALGEVAVEGLSVSNVNDWDLAWDTNQVAVLMMSGVRDGWIRDVVSFESALSTDGRGRHLMSGGIRVVDSVRVTVAESSMEYAQNRGGGGNGYLFEVSRSNEVLFRDDLARAGRHNFIQNWDFGTSGIVWLRTFSADGEGFPGTTEVFGYPAYSEFHHSLATANLIDASVAPDGWQAVNRQDESSGAGHTATETVFWNFTGGYLRSLQYGDGYVVGTDGADVHVDPAEPDLFRPGEGTAPQDFTEGLGAADTLVPASLYEDQLARRSANGF